MISLELIFRITKDGNSITVQKGFKDGIEIIFSDCENLRHKASFFTYGELKIFDVNFSRVVEQLYDDFLTCEEAEKALKESEK